MAETAARINIARITWILWWCDNTKEWVEKFSKSTKRELIPRNQEQKRTVPFCSVFCSMSALSGGAGSVISTDGWSRYFL